MKKTVYISGVITANLLLIGCVFKVNHWPGAGIALTLSLLMLSFWFMPAALINHYKGQKGKKNIWLYISTYITFSIVFIAALFKILHWPGASMLILVGVPIPFLFFLPIFIFHSAKNKDQSFTNFTGVILGLIFIAVYGVFLNINVSRDVLFHGVDLIKNHEKTIDVYEYNLETLSHGIDNNTITEIRNKSDKICLLIHKAKADLLEYSENSHIHPDLGKKEFNISAINNLDSRNAAQYILRWKDGAKGPEIEKELKLFKAYLSDLHLNKEAVEVVNQVYYLQDEILEDEKITWIDRELSSDYLVYALESLSRWEKNVRFVENVVLSELVQKQEKDI